MDYHNFQSFDITRLVEKHENTKLEVLFPNHEIIKNDMGELMDITWKEDKIPSQMNFNITRKNLLCNLKTVHYIGYKIEKHLIGRGFKTLNDLKFHLRYQGVANKLIDLIKKKDYKTLCDNRYINDLDVLFCFDKEKLLFIDIETLGLYDSPIIIIGLGFFKDSVFEIHQLFARDLEEEIAMCEHLKKEILPNFQAFVSYNGKSFDIPYLANRFLYFFDENPMITEETTPYEDSNTIFHHIDLYHNCRREFKGQFESYTLTNMEEKLLEWDRENELPSRLVGMCYRKYKENPDRYIGLVKECIEHNYYDIYSMPLILKKLLEVKVK